MKESLPQRELVEGIVYWAMKRLLDQKDIAEADILYRANASCSISFMDGRLDEKVKGQNLSMGVRVIDAEGRQGVACSNHLSKDAVNRVIEWALFNCKNNDPNPHIGLNSEILDFTEDHDLFDPLVIDGMSFSRGEKICSVVTGEVRGLDERVSSIREVFYGEGYEETLYLSSEGAIGWQDESVVRLDVALIMEDDDKIEMGGFGEEQRYLSDLKCSDIAKNAVHRTSMTLGGKPLKTGKYTLFLDSLTAASLVSMLEDSFLADNVHKGKSWLSDKRGRMIAPSHISLVDDATIKRGMGSYIFDGEGVVAQRTTLLSEGVVTNFLYNLEHARIDGVSSTGNCLRSPASIQYVGASNLFITPGIGKAGDLYGDLSTGIYVTELIGLHTFDPVSGDLSLGIKGAYIRNGSIDGPLSGMTVAGNIYDILNRIVRVGEDLKFYGSVGSPSLVIDDVSTAGD